jgi:hypothetical protein
MSHGGLLIGMSEEGYGKIPGWERWEGRVGEGERGRRGDGEG